MCGICGIIYKNGEKKPLKNLIVAMTHTMTHRGPDDEGIFIDTYVGLGHRRLSIIDRVGGRQPIYNEDKSICVVFNGEIYNFDEIRTDLIRKGHHFSTESDTEVIVHSYEEYGSDCVQQLRGMFAFALYDRNRNICFMARDRLGEKPLYFYEDDQVFIFSSEVKAILKSGYVKARVNLGSLDFYLTLGYVPAPHTLFDGIYKLAPGSYIWVEKGNVSFNKYWSLESVVVVPTSFQEACQRLQKLLFESVRLQLMSEVPLGIFLSGGLDSSTIVACICQLVDGPIKTFSVGYKNADNVSELEFARRVAIQFKTDHHEYNLTPQDLFDSMYTVTEYTEEPIVESAAIALFHLSKLARSEVTVVLSGEGADELFAGYPIYAKIKMLERIRYFARLFPVSLLQKFNLPVSEKVQKYLDWLGTPFEKSYHSVSCDLTKSVKKKMYTEEFKKKVEENQVERFFELLYQSVPSRSLLNKMLFIDTQTWLPDDLLLKADKMTMAASVELRVPFLDYKIVEFAASLPDEYKLSGRIGKFILKKVMEAFLPKEIIYRRKRGFPLPISQWFRQELYGPACDLLLDPNSTMQRYVKTEYLESVVKKHKTGTQDLSRRIFSLLTLELWFRKYLN